jgi:hypothetical protein
MPAARIVRNAPMRGNVRPLAMNGGVAPVCPVSRSQAVANQPPIPPSVIPLANDLPSVIRAVNMIITMYNLDTTIPNWQEISRTVTPVRIFNPNDSSQWVDVERIAQLTFQDQTTNGLFQWTY